MITGVGMRPKIKHCTSLKIIPVVFLVTLILMPALALSEETYKFERMWPALQQPWYFESPRDVSVDSKGYILVADTGGNRIVKLTSDGFFVAEWRGSSSDDGHFQYPIASASESQSAYFISGGDISFSKFFWGQRDTPTMIYTS